MRSKSTILLYMSLSDIRTTNKLLLILVIPVVFYILVILKHIFIPLMFAIFIALLFSPLMRWLKRRNIHQIFSMLIVLLVLFGSLMLTIKVVQVSGKEIALGKKELYVKLDNKVADITEPAMRILGIESTVDQGRIKQIVQSKTVEEFIVDNFGNTFKFLRKTVTIVLMTMFFLILLLAGSWNLKMITYDTFSQGRTKYLKTFVAIEKSISQFLKVKFLVSLLTGVSFGLVCYVMGISFPVFWGLFAFAINFIQMIGSFIAVLLASIFAYIEIESPGALLTAVLLLAGVQILFGSIIEPILMGRSFSINIITVLIVLMFWGFLWGISGLILAIPLTVLLKTILSELKGTEKLLRLMS